MTKASLLASACAFALTAFTGAALAHYPEKPVPSILPWLPGDLEDGLTPLIADAFQTMHAAPAAVVNRPGGGGIVRALEVAGSSPGDSVIGSFTPDIPTSAQIYGTDADFGRTVTMRDTPGVTE